MKNAVIVAALALWALAGPVKADTIYDAFVEVNIYYGVVQVYSPTDVLLSTNQAMTVETQFPFSEQVTDGYGAFSPYYMPLMNPLVEQMLNNNPVPPIPAYITTNLPSFANSNGFGAELDVDSTPVDPNATPTPSSMQLYQMLTTQPVPFVVTSDSGFVLLGPQSDYVAEFGPFGSLPPPAMAGDTIEGGTLVDIYERNLQLQETSAPVPEPGSLGLLGIVVGLMLWKHSRG